MSEQSTASGIDDAGDAGPAAASSREDVGAAVPAAEPLDGAAEARVLGLESTDAEAVLGAVASDTARTVLAALYDEPTTASGVAGRVDCSLQTVQYHLGNLSDAGLVDVVDTATSEKGRPMDVYGPAGRPVVVYAGDDDDAADLRTVLGRLVSGVAFLGVLGLLVQELFGSDGRATMQSAGDTGVAFSAEAVDAADGAAAAAGPEPGLVFFAGGLAVLVASLALWYLRSQGTLDRLRASV